MKKLALALIYIGTILLSTTSYGQGCSLLVSKGCKTSVIQSKEYKLDSYTSWVWLTGYEHSGLHWNQFVSLYINQDVETYKHNYATYVKTYLEDEDEDEETEPTFKKYKEGTVLAKENFIASHGKPGDLMSITIMVKKSAGYYPEGGNWEYLQFSADGKLMLKGHQGTPAIKAACASCHLNVAERDFIFSSMMSSTLNWE